VKKRQGKNLTKSNRREEPKIKVLTHELLAFTLSYLMASSLMIHQLFKSLFTDSSHVKFGHHLSIFLLPIRLIISLRIGASVGLRCICPNHLKRYCRSFSSTGVTLVSHVCHHFRPDLFLCYHKSIVACAYQLHLVVGHVAS
jgi:hypothetical protein